MVTYVTKCVAKNRERQNNHMILFLWKEYQLCSTKRQQQETDAVTVHVYSYKQLCGSWWLL